MRKLCVLTIGNDKYLGNIVYFFKGYVSVDLGDCQAQLYDDHRKYFSGRMLAERKYVKELVFNNETGKFEERELA